MPKRPKRPSVPRSAATDARHFICFYRPTFSHTLMADVDRGDADAQFALARVYFEGRAEASSTTTTVTSDGLHEIASFTPGVPRNHAAATALLQQAADQGHAEARQLLEVVRLHTPKGVH